MQQRLRHADNLVAKLWKLGYIVHGPTFEIYRHHGQPMMNKAAGEAAPAWELLENPLYNTLTGCIVAHGERPQVQCPDGTCRLLSVCSHMPLLHILRQPIDTWIVYIDPLIANRLCIETTALPESWT